MFLFGLAVGVFAAGTLMYYLQPSIKDAVAKAFGWEATVAASLYQRAAELRYAARGLKP